MKRRCDHTMHLTDGDGNCVGSWVEEKHNGGARIVCRYCRKFYGYIVQPRKGKAHASV